MPKVSKLSKVKNPYRSLILGAALSTILSIVAGCSYFGESYDYPRPVLGTPNLETPDQKNSEQIDPALIEIEKNFVSLKELVLAPNKCTRCHTPTGKSGIDLTSLQGILKTVVPGAPEKSDLFLSLKNNGGQMPPKGEPLKEEEVQLIKRFILDLAPPSPKPEEPVPTEPPTTTTTTSTTTTVPEVVPPPVLPPPVIEPVPPVESPVTFERIKTEIFEKQCSMCHNSQKARGGVDVTNLENLTVGADATVIPMDPNASVLFKEVVNQKMPTSRAISAGTARLLTVDEIELIRKWISEGAKP